MSTNRTDRLRGMPPGPSLTGRAVQALALLIGFYVLALVVAGVLIALPILELRGLHRIDVRILGFCWIGAGAILLGLLPRVEKFVAPGLRLDEAAHPELFALIRGVAGDLEQPMPRDIYLIPQANAWVSQRGGVMGIGSRRVMGIGLPLLQVMRVDELRAVLAHEFGHYYGGDTGLGPWLYSTRAAIGRTLGGLSAHSSLLAAPFRAYGTMFLRLTHAVSRAQEFAADRVAAWTQGAAPLAAALGKLPGSAEAFNAYWANEFVPALSRGVRPPLLQGFARFLEETSIQDYISSARAAALQQEETGAFDTHPPLPLRIEALHDLPESPAVPQEDARPAHELMSDLDALERALIAWTATDPAAVDRLTPVEWESVAESVWLPLWLQQRERLGERLRGVTFAQLAELLVTPEAYFQRLSPDGAMAQDPAGSWRDVLAFTSAMVTLALHDRGWRIVTPVAGAVEAHRDGRVAYPFTQVNAVVARRCTADEWSAWCRDLGLADEDAGTFSTPS